MSPAHEAEDPVLARRRTVARWSRIGKRFGYGCVLASIVAFTIGMVTSFSEPVIWTVMVSLALSAVALIPAVIFGYGVSMAEREEKGQPFTY